MRRLCAAFAVLAFLASWIACSGDGPGTSAATSGSSSGSWALCNDPGEPCRTADDCCVLWDRRCGDKICDQGVCAIDLVQEFKSQARGDCIYLRCDASGVPREEPAPDDIDPGGNPCIVHLCEMNQPLIAAGPKGPAPDGSGLFCDGDGHRVECLEAADCDDPSRICSHRFKCVPPHCDNGQPDPSLDETETDCGGPCDPCIRGFACNKHEDCVSLSCGADHTCVRPACDDGRRNGNEVDVDCGSYACNTPCPEGAGCFGDADCTTGSCFAGKCQPRSCEDGKRNGDEENIDCGGSDCPSCW
ncbi:uncharacterized protein SOCE26_076750 [Sorangium cellulosum]|uniref:Secreted protein n=1 Tax=Sorangium cellulosum TaxID=56 RepID=A0A2L0F3N3_SORCE|nr:hypothetical protein [Sorangium cellulosum]AUX46170.1 uncharacterized protein SOCE26_076750 [Sorangium cellulosum]